MVGFTRLSLEKAAAVEAVWHLAEMLNTGRIGTVRNAQEEMVEKFFGRSWLLNNGTPLMPS